MSKSMKYLISFVILGCIFAGGYFVGKVTNAEVLKEVSISYKGTDENAQDVIYKKQFTDLENPSVIDNFIMIYLYTEEIEKPDVDIENPDMYINLNSPNASAGLIDSRLWFIDEYAVIGRREGVSWDKVKFYKIEGYDVEYIKEVTLYKE